MKKSIVTLSLLLAAGFAPAQDAAYARAEYQREQALAEVPRLVQQFEVLVQNQDEIAQRLVKLESTDSTAGLRAEIDALRAEIAGLRASIRAEQDAMRQEIVKDLMARVLPLIQQQRQQPAPPPQQVVVVQPPRGGGTAAQPPPSHTTPAAAIGPHYEDEVKPGQTLSYIAKGFDTTVAKILAANPKLKPNALRPGQKLIIPAEDKPQPPPSKKPAPRR